jgi:hypothetical protein
VAEAQAVAAAAEAQAELAGSAAAVSEAAEAQKARELAEVEAALQAAAAETTALQEQANALTKAAARQQIEAEAAVTARAVTEAAAEAALAVEAEARSEAAVGQNDSGDTAQREAPPSEQQLQAAEVTAATATAVPAAADVGTTAATAASMQPLPPKVVKSDGNSGFYQRQVRSWLRLRRLEWAAMAEAACQQLGVVEGRAPDEWLQALLALEEDGAGEARLAGWVEQASRAAQQQGMVVMGSSGEQSGSSAEVEGWLRTHASHLDAQAAAAAAHGKQGAQGGHVRESERDWHALAGGVALAFKVARWDPSSWLGRLKDMESGALLDDFLQAVQRGDADAQLMAKLAQSGRFAVFRNQVGGGIGWLCLAVCAHCDPMMCARGAALLRGRPPGLALVMRVVAVAAACPRSRSSDRRRAAAIPEAEEAACTLSSCRLPACLPVVVVSGAGVQVRAWLGHKGHASHAVLAGVISAFENQKHRPEMWVEELEALEQQCVEPPIDAPCTQCLRHGDLIHARKALTAWTLPSSFSVLAARDSHGLSGSFYDYV